jgi:hypothetical protein
VNPTRLTELHHQRALVREQLAWLEGEIAKESVGLMPPLVVATPHADPLSQIKYAAEIEAYRPDPISAVAETRRGCFIAVVLAAVLIAAALSAIYVLRYRDRPLIFVSRDIPKAGNPASVPKK